MTQLNAFICTAAGIALSRFSSSVVANGTWCTIQRRSLIPNSALTASYAQTTCASPARLPTLFSFRQRACATSRCASIQTAPAPSGAAHSPIDPVIIMSSPKNWNEFFSRSFSSGRFGSFWLCRKFVCSRTNVLPSRWRASHESYIR